MYRWNLVREYDAYGGANPLGSAPPTPVNVIVYRYIQDGAIAYVSDIYDTPPAANPSSAPLAAYAHHTHLAYETRTDPTTSYRRGWATQATLRLSGVDVTSQTFGAAGDRELVRRYHLAYDPSYHLSLLASVQLEGRCMAAPGQEQSVTEDASGLLPATGCPTLPAMTFGYQHVQGFDVSGSPRTADLLGYEPFDERVVPLSNSPPHSVDESLTDLLDVNADGLPDVVVTNPAEFGGNLGVYFNSAAGQPNAFGDAATMPVVGVANEDATTITFQNVNVSAADIDGDGIVDLIHMPQVRDYSVYSPQGTGTAYSWVGRSIVTASQQRPKIDFGNDAQNIHVVDVNGDGLVDLVHTGGTAIETFFSLGRFPNGDGQFGHARWTGPTSADISNDPVSYCLPYAGLPVQFGDANTKLADLNGDGLQDIVYAQQGNIQYWPGRGNGYFGTGDPSACPAGGFGQSTSIAMAASPWYSDPNGSTLRFDDVNGDGLDDLIQVGFDFVEIWLNVDGAGWTQVHTISGTPPAPSYASRVRLTDANGSGTRDVLWGDGGDYKYIDLQGGARPWVLTHVQNGLGKTTDIEYASSAALMLEAAASGNAWASVAPMPVHVVRRVTDRDNLDRVGRAGGVYVTEYDFRDPVYEGRQREFRGFRTGTKTRLGDANSPTSSSTSTFLLGECRNDENVSPDPCTPAGRWLDSPREALKGLESTSETYDASGVYLSTVHHTHRLRKLYTGVDGREVRSTFESQGDAYSYDTAPFLSAPQQTAVIDVELETTPGTSNTDTTASITLRSLSGRAHVHKSRTVDLFGNAVTATDDGCVLTTPGDTCPGSDESITSTAVSGVVSGDASGWIVRTSESFVTGSVTMGVGYHLFFTYDANGGLVATAAELVGSLALDRFHEDSSRSIAPPPPTASQDGKEIQLGARHYDAFGQTLQETAPNARCRQLVYDASYNALPVQETVFVGFATASCTGTSVYAVAQYDRGLGAVTQITDVHGELTKAQYDGFGRPTVLYKPDPQSIGSTAPVASVINEYVLPSDPTTTPYTIVHTQVQTGPDASTPLYRDGWAYSDGLGRAVVALGQADPSAGDGGGWVVGGLSDYDAKGAPRRAYLPWFWSGTPSQFPLGTTPSTAYASARYDPFGRQSQTFGLDGTISRQTAYHALSVDTWDAADLLPGPHQGTPASAVRDGHGRTIAITERVHNGGTIEAHDVRTTYRATGEPVTISRVRVGAADAPVVRWMRYDSLGRMVLNAEPDTTKGFNPDPSTDPSAMNAWRYAYDDNGDLVGTSDARGCGENYFYDAGGRLRAEDFSPCLSSQQPYSAPDLTTGDRTEAYYEYDQADPDAATIPGFSIDATLLLGRLVGVADRGAKNLLAYDGSGRTVGLARRMAAPGTPNDVLAQRYTPHWYMKTVSYDGADRPVTTTTGADVPELLDSTGHSQVTATYSARGTVSRVDSGYGTLVRRVSLDAGGQVNEIVYGDAAQTTTAVSYDTRQRVSSVQTYRGPPALWTQPPPAYAPPPPYGGPPGTLQLLLQDTDFVYDVVDNPIEIRDFRNPAEWPSGAQPVTRKIEYDDLYRVTRVAYAYPTGSDTWISPFAAEDSGIDSDPRRAQPGPHVSFDQRVKTQSFQYDWLGNTTQTDDDAHGFYDRSLGAIGNGTALRGPYQLASAHGAGGPRGGSLTTAYDDAGNLVSLAVSRQGSCSPAGATCSQRFAYDWDESGRLARARRWDVATPGSATDPLPTSAAAADLQYAYDATDNRTLKTAVDPQGNQVHTAYVFDSLELRRATFDGTDYERTAWTEVPYLAGLARLHYAANDVPSLTSGQQHVLLNLPDHLGSSAITLDLATSELVEASTYLAYGSPDSDYRPSRWDSYRDDRRFTGKEDDIECGLTYFGHRYLSTTLGRWVSADPLTIHGGGADANAYAYVHGAILGATDAAGLDDGSAKSNATNGSPEDSILGTVTVNGSAPCTELADGNFDCGSQAPTATEDVWNDVQFLRMLQSDDSAPTVSPGFDVGGCPGQANCHATSPHAPGPVFDIDYRDPQTDNRIWGGIGLAFAAVDLCISCLTGNLPGALNAVDNGQASVRQLITGQPTATIKEEMGGKPFELAINMLTLSPGGTVRQVAGEVASREASAIRGFGSRINTGAPTVRKFNCVFCTAGGSSGAKISSSSAAAIAGMIEGPVGNTVADVGEVFKRLGLGDGSYRGFSNYADAATYMLSESKGTRFGVVFDNPGSTWGHAVAGNRGSLGLYFRDYQASSIPWFRPQGADKNATFYIFKF
jgi:RHS repeat-associated protein